MPKDLFIISMEGGHVKNNTAFIKFIRGLKDGKHLIERSNYNKRSNQANRYYWGVVITMIQQAINDHGSDYTKEEIHELLKANFNRTDFVIASTGECISIPLSTTRLSKAKFSDYITKIQAWAAETLEIVVPDPGEQMMLEYE